MQLRMSPTGGIPSSVRRTPDEPPSSATVTIAVRLLVCSLSPRRSVDRPVPPPIATIARAAGQEPLLVDELDERLVRIGSAKRVGQDADGPIRAERDEDDADRPGDEAAQGVRQELEREHVDERPGQPGRFEIPGDLAEEVGERERQQQQAGEDDERASA